MDNLWKKESSGGRYVDLFSSQDYLEHIFEEFIDKYGNLNAMPHRKDNAHSTKLREHGNELFKARNWSKAMVLYNESLCYAEIGSESEALAFSNRSACFFNMEMYQESLTDTEKATSSANIPENLLLKLEQRQKECRELMQQARTPEVLRKLKLSYKADENFPCMANVVEIKYNEEFGRHLVAKSDIPVGQIVMMEKEFITARENERALCCTCFQTERNFIACPHCPGAVFCDRDCMDKNLWHKWECGSPLIQLNFKMKFYIRAIFMAIACFQSVDRLVDFVDSALREDRDAIPTLIHDLKSNYHFFFKLKRLPETDADITAAYVHYRCLEICPKVKELFDSEEKRRFLMHLILHSNIIIQANAFSDVTSIHMNNVISMANHACSSNLINYRIGNHGVFETINFVKEGEQLCFNYLGKFNAETNERQNDLESKWRFICKCAACKPGNNLVNHRLASDPRFKFVFDNVHDEQMSTEVLENCRQFLNEHGHVEWSAEIGFISQVFGGLITVPAGNYSVH